MADLTEHVEQFARRVIQDALVTADAWCWVRRAEALEAAMPQADDFTGRATPEALEARRERLEATATACRHHADLLSRGGAA